MWILLPGAFLCGLLFVGIALLLPGRGDREPGIDSPVSNLPQSSRPQPAPPAPPRPDSSVRPARLAVVVDDLGYDPSRDSEWMKFPERITVSVIPFGPSSREVAESAGAKGWGVILHVPMEPGKPSPDRTEGFRLRPGMTGDQIESLVGRMIDGVPGARGASNHMGSAFTADPAAMAAFSAVLKKRNLYLLDSVTTPGSVAVEAARRAGVPSVRRDVVLDENADPGEIRRRWDMALAVAKEKGDAVLVCHGRPDTLRAILELLPDLRKERIEAVTLEELVREKGA